jgi:O-antigen/teichoic acid export membrane protein
MDAVYVSSMQFQAFGLKLLWQNLVFLLACFLPIPFGAAGVVAGRSAYAVARFVLRLRGLPLAACGPGTLPEVRYLTKVGMPLFIAGLLANYLAVADRSVVVCFFTPLQVGKFSLAWLVTNALQFIPSSLGTVLYPRFTALYGRRRSSRALLGLFGKSLVLILAAVVPASLAAYFLVAPVTKALFPNYAEGIAAARISAIGAIATGFVGASCVIASVRRNTPYVLAIGLSLAGVWALGTYLIAHGGGVEAVAWARALATGFLFLFTIGYSYWLIHKDVRPAC